MPDYAMQFEKVICHYLGEPVTTIYYANYFEYDFSRKALLFSICVKEQNVNAKSYSERELSYLRNLLSSILSDTATYDDLVKCIQFFSGKISV
jgi:hypothetical protein